jgi:hypothetical protein
MSDALRQTGADRLQEDLQLVNAFATSSTASHAGSTKITPPRRVALRKVSSCFMVLIYFTRLIGGGASRPAELATVPLVAPPLGPVQHIIPEAKPVKA